MGKAGLYLGRRIGICEEVWMELSWVEIYKLLLTSESFLGERRNAKTVLSD